MLYALYNEETGGIHQANKVYDHEGDDERGKKSYDALLNDLGHKFVKVNAPGLLPPDHWFVDVSVKEIRERPVMHTIEVNKTKITCGDKDSCLITGIPKKAKARITMQDGTEVYPSFVLDAEQLEISIPVPCVYRVHLDLWPYKTFTLEIEATV